MAEALSISPRESRDETSYHNYLQAIQDRFLAVIGTGKTLLFQTAVADLFDRFLNALPLADRQHYTCHTCRNFVRTFGGLVVVNADGSLTSLFWNPADAPDDIRSGIDIMQRLVESSRITEVFNATGSTWGVPQTKEWRHFAVQQVPHTVRYQGSLKTPFQATAEKTQDHQNVLRALGEFTTAQLQQVVGLLESDALYRSEACLGAARWLLRMKEIYTTNNQRVRDTLLWAEIAGAPAGFCHPRSSMIGTLLDDIVAGLPFDQVSARFAAKMHPLRHMRPQAAPTEGNIQRAEEIVSKLAIAPSLERRYAKLEEVVKLWQPRVEAVQLWTAGVFGHLKPKAATPQPVNTGTQDITWIKFRDTVLPQARKIELLVPYHRSTFGAIMTAVHPDSPPILQWDNLEQRNPFSWYLIANGSAARDWNLVPGPLVEVTAVTLSPQLWYAQDGQFEHLPTGVFFLLKGARPTTKSPGLSLFPVILKSDLREVRTTIEAYSNSRHATGKEEASACGLLLQKGNERWRDGNIRVYRDSGIVTDYRLDRWD